MTRLHRSCTLILGLSWTLWAGAQAPASGPASPPAPAQTSPADLSPGVSSAQLEADRRSPEAPAQGGAKAKANPAAAPQQAAKVAAAKGPAAATPGPRKGNSADRLELGTTEISGNRELPKVLYVVPWRRPEIGDAVGRPPNSLIDEALSPVDRSVFQRQNRYFAALEAGTAPAKSQPQALPGQPPGAAH